jgi:hypothetical protein
VRAKFFYRLTDAREAHRNIYTRMSMIAQVQQTFLAKKNLVKSLLIYPRQGNLLQGKNFTGLNKISLYNTR